MAARAAADATTAVVAGYWRRTERQLDINERAGVRERRVVGKVICSILD
jgi:hypothetical protein